MTPELGKVLVVWRRAIHQLKMSWNRGLPPSKQPSITPKPMPLWTWKSLDSPTTFNFLMAQWLQKLTKVWLFGGEPSYLLCNSKVLKSFVVVVLEVFLGCGLDFEWLALFLMILNASVWFGMDKLLSCFSIYWTRFLFTEKILQSMCGGYSILCSPIFSPLSIGVKQSWNQTLMHVLDSVVGKNVISWISPLQHGINGSVLLFQGCQPFQLLWQTNRSNMLDEAGEQVHIGPNYLKWTCRDVLTKHLISIPLFMRAWFPWFKTIIKPL